MKTQYNGYSKKGGVYQIINKKNGKTYIGSAKKWTFISPSKQVYTFQNLNQFCKENGLSQSHMVQVANGKRKSHKGWTCNKSLVA